MRRILSLLALMAVIVAACGEESVGTTVAPSTTAPAALLLSYEFEPGTILRYEVDFQQHMTMSATGDPTVMGGDEVPGTADLEISGLTTFTHTVEEGAEPGTFDIIVVGEFAALSVTGTVDDEPVDSGEIPDLAQIEPIRTTVTVDEKGNVLSTSDGSVGGGGLGGDLGAIGGVGGMSAPGLDLGSLVGPSLPEREVTVGDSWSETIEDPMPFGGEPLIITVESTVSGTDTVDGAEVFVIDTTSSTSAIDLDLGEMMIGFFESFIPEQATAEERAELEAMMDGLRFLMTMEPSSSLTTTWFDPEGGHALRSRSSGSTVMSFDINFPDEATGEMTAFAMEMTLDQTIEYRLLDTASA